MDGKLNCSMTAENAAFTKIRHLENRVVETETRLDVLEQETTQLDEALQNALENLQETVVTENVDTGLLRADSIGTALLTADDIDVKDVTATSIEAETIDVDNLENVNVLHGKTVDVEKTIATIGQFTETHTTEANNSTTNTTELNVDGETNLTGQVNIDGNVTFTKDNGLSKLQGNYLEIDAANVVIDNKNSSEYALYVPGVDGDALFGGSVAVQDTLAAKNLIVTGEAHFSKLTLNENTVLTNPTLADIKQTQELTDKALDIDENGKIVRKFVAGGSAGTVASALIANETRYNYGGLLDKYKQVEEEGAPYQIILSDTASYTFYPDSNGNPYLENSNGQRYVFEVEPQFRSMLQMLSLVHKNIFYTVVPNGDDDDVKRVIGGTLLKINMNNMNVEYSIDVSEYFTISFGSLLDTVTWIPSQAGNILSDDKPVLPFIGTNKYVDLVSGNILTRDTKFSSGSAYYLSKTNNWYQLVGSVGDCWVTNNKYSSIEDAALVDTPYQDDNAGGVNTYIVDAPVFWFKGRRIEWFDRGISNELILNSKTVVLVLDENDNKVLFSPGLLRFNGVEYATNLYNNLGYVVNKYIAEIPYYIEKVKIDRTEADFTDVPVTADTITINDKATIKDIETSNIDAEVVKTTNAEVDGMTFYRGKWYDKVFSSAKPLVDYILDTTDKSPYQTYNILFTGNVLDFRAADLPDTAITSSQVIGTYKVYSDSNDDVRELNFVENGYDPLAIGFHLFNSIYFYGFETQLDVASKDNTRCLHLNNCTLYFKDNYGTNTSVGTFELNKCNNVSITATNINWNNSTRPQWENCNNVQLRNWGFTQGGTYSSISISIWMADCNDCFIAVPPVNIKTVSFVQVGKGSNLVLHFQSEYGGTKIEPKYQ